RPPASSTNSPPCSEVLRRSAISALGEAHGDQPAQGERPVAALLFLRGRHLGEGALLALRHEHRVVAEAARAARLLDQLALDPALRQLLVAVRPGPAEHR